MFGDAVTGGDGRPPLAVSSTKGATGHLLGAAGAVEAIFTVLALARGVAPPTANLLSPDPPLLLPGLVRGGSGTSGGGKSSSISSPSGPSSSSANRSGGVALPPGPRAALTNSFGFGGTNASLVFATPPAPAPGAAV